MARRGSIIHHGRVAFFFALAALLAPIASAAASPRWELVAWALGNSSYGRRGAGFSLVVGNRSGILYNASFNGHSPGSLQNVASASKLVSAWAVARLVDAGRLTWGALTSQYLPPADWPAPPSALGSINLTTLLSFTSGLPLTRCTDGIGGDPAALPFWPCVANASSAPPSYTPAGTVFEYGGQHEHVAGAMAASALAGSPVPPAGWPAVFAGLRAAVNLSASQAFYTPLANPQPAGGLAISANGYASLLLAYVRGELGISAASRAYLERDWTPRGVRLAVSPFSDMGFEFHYALGHWVECRLNPLCGANGSLGSGCRSPPSATWLPSCDAGCERSSVGASGVMPYLDSCTTFGSPSASVEPGYFALFFPDTSGSAIESVLLGSALWPAVRAALATQVIPPAAGASISASPTATQAAASFGTRTGIDSASAAAILLALVGLLALL